MQMQHNGLLAIFSLSVVSVLISSAHLSDYAVNDSYRLSRLSPDYLNPRGPLQFGFVHAMLCRCGLHGAQWLTSQTPSRQHWYAMVQAYDRLISWAGVHVAAAISISPRTF
jgi:hypothetical protein